MATVAGAGGERMLLRQRRLPLGDLTNFSSTSVLTRLKPSARRKPRTSPSAGSSTSSIGSSAPNTRCPPPPPPPLSVAAVIKGKDKSTRELQSSSSHLKKINKTSKPKVETGDVMPSASSPPSKKTRKLYQVTREELPHMQPLEQSSGEPLPSQDFINEQRAYFAKIDAFELVEEFVSSGSDVQKMFRAFYLVIYMKSMSGTYIHGGTNELAHIWCRRDQQSFLVDCGVNRCGVK